MKNIRQKLLFITLLLMPTMVFASEENFSIDITGAILAEAFISIHMSVFVLKPLSQILFKENSTKAFWIMFAIRAAFLLIFDFFITTNIVIVDFFAVFIGAMFVVPLFSSITGVRINHKSNQVIKTPPQFNTQHQIKPQQNNQIKGIELKCAKCNSVWQVKDRYCANCGAPFDNNNVIVSETTNAVIQPIEKEMASPSNFDNIYSLPENKMIEEFLNKELIKAGIDKTSKLIPTGVLKKKKIFNIIFSFLLFIFVSLIFFHFPIITYIIGLIILLIFFIVTRRYNLIKYLTKQLKARPKEKISNIVMSVKNDLVEDHSTKILFASLLIGIALPLIIFSKPRIIYEKVDDGYAVRYYTFGLTNYKTAIIPEKYKNEDVVSLRGNTFSNMPFLESVELPDSITEIRGQAFKNCKKLTTVNIPKKLEYLGGGAFYNAQSIKRIELPNTLKYLGGESFYSATSLEYIKLSNNLTEIRGDSFKYCTSLTNIIIPDSVKRIGAHAFYGASSLSNVFIGENSNLKEIGSSAFRRCSSLRSITIPTKTYVNERAFKESPTSIKRYEFIKEPIVENEEENKEKNKEKMRKEIERLKQNINNNIIELVINQNQKKELDYIMFDSKYDMNAIVINEYELLITYNTSISANKTEAAILFDIKNYNKHNGNFNLSVDYYDETYKKIGSCGGTTNLYENYSYDYANCIFERNEANVTVDDIKYYKIYIENYNIKQ